MHVAHLSLTDFRSYESVELGLEPGVTAFVGPNGQGKTNLVEALGYVAAHSSHRVAADAPLVRHGAPRADANGTAMNIDKMTSKAQEALRTALAEATRRGNPEVLPEHICLAVIAVALLLIFLFGVDVVSS